MVIRWLGRAAGCTAASALEDVRAHLTQRGRRLWRWVRGRTRVVLPRCQTYSSHWNHIRSCKASDMFALLATGVAEQPPCAEIQASMMRVKRYWRLPVAVAPAQALRQGRGEVRAWAQKCFSASFRSPGPAGACHRGGFAKPDGAGPVFDGPKPCDELTHYKTHLTKPAAEGEVLVQEDTDKSAAWRMPIQLYLHWVAHLLVADTVHWRRVDCSVQELSALYHHLHRGGLPRRFAYMASAHRWTGFGFNYMYT